MADFASGANSPSQYKTRFAIENFQRDISNLDTSQIYKAILFCQGHFTPHAADFVNENLLTFLNQQVSQNPEQKLSVSLEKAYQQVQQDMWDQWKYIWPKEENGHYSISGTSATTVVITGNGKLVTGHVGGSVVYLASFQMASNTTEVIKLTSDHFLQNSVEYSKLLQSSGWSLDCLSTKQNTDETTNKNETCLAWNQGECVCKPFRKPDKYDVIPMTCLTRTLGDFWNYSEIKRNRILSAEPEISKHILPQDGKNYLIFLSQQMAKSVDPIFIQEAVQHAEKNCTQNVTKLLIEGAAIHNTGQAQFENMSVLVIPLFSSQIENFPLGLERSFLDTREIYCTYNLEINNNLAIVPFRNKAWDPINLVHTSKTVYGPSGYQLKNRVSLNVIKCSTNLELLQFASLPSLASGRRQLEVKRREFKFTKKHFKHVRYRFPFRQYFEWSFTRNLANHYKYKRIKSSRKFINRKYKRKRHLIYGDRLPAPNKVVHYLGNTEKQVNLIHFRRQFFVGFRTKAEIDWFIGKNAEVFHTNTNCLDPHKMYVLMRSCFLYSLSEIPICNLPECVKFFPMPGSMINQEENTSIGFHLSENIFKYQDLLAWVEARILESHQHFFGHPRTGIIFPEQFGVENSYMQVFVPRPPEKQLLFKVPIQIPSLRNIAEDDSIKVFLLPQPPNILPERPKMLPLPCAQPCSSSENVLPPMPQPSKSTIEEFAMAARCFQGRGIIRPNSVIIRNPSGSKDQKRKEGPSRENSDPKRIKNEQDLNKPGTSRSSMSLAFMDRGCGGKCIIPGEAEKKLAAAQKVKTVKPEVISKEPDEAPLPTKDVEESVNIENPETVLKPETKEDFEYHPVPSPFVLHIPEQQEEAHFSLLEILESQKLKERQQEMEEAMSNSDGDSDAETEAVSANSSPEKTLTPEYAETEFTSPEQLSREQESYLRSLEEPEYLVDNDVNTELKLESSPSMKTKQEIKQEIRFEPVLSHDVEITELEQTSLKRKHESVENPSETSHPKQIKLEADSESRAVYQTIGGVKVKINPASILKLTGKTPDECFKELKRQSKPE